MRRTTAALLTVPLLALAACGSEEAGEGDATASADLPAVSGAYGETPEVEVPGGEPGAELVVEVLAEGDGEAVQAGDVLVADYHGQTWEPGEDGPNVFDSSFERGAPAAFPIGVGQVIPGWDQGLVGQPEGSRVLLVIPPEQGYGAEGTPDGSIPGGSTLVFVVDVIDAISSDTPVSGDPVQDLPAGLPTVSGQGGPEAPTVTVPEGAEPPEASDAVVVLEGDGEDLGEQIVVNVLQQSFESGEVQFSSWAQGAPTVLNPAQIPGLGEALADQQVGTRALVLVSAEDNAGQDGSAGEPLVLVVDVIGTVPGAAA